jgi:hypothetical protein
MPGMRGSLIRVLALAAVLPGLGACAGYPVGYAGEYGGGYVAQPSAYGYGAPYVAHPYGYGYGYGYGGGYAARPYRYHGRPYAYRPVPGYAHAPRTDWRGHGGWGGGSAPHGGGRHHDGGRHHGGRGDDGVGGLVSRLAPTGGPPRSGGWGHGRRRD